MKTKDMRRVPRQRFTYLTRTSARALTLLCVAVSSGLLLTAQQPQPVGSWASLGQDVADSRVGAASAVLPDGRTLIAGGLVDGLPVASVLIYDPLTNTVVTAGEMTVARVRHTATVLADGRVLFAGGRVADQVTPDLEVFSLPTDSAEQGSAVIVGTMWAEREGHAAAALTDGSVLIAGGANAGGPLNSAEIFDPVTNSVQATWHPMDTARAGLSATRLIDGRVLIAGGTTRDGDGNVRDLASAELYQPELQAFYPATTEMSIARSGHSALLLPHNNSVLIAGGSSNGALVASTDLFLPAEFPDAISVGTGEFAPTGAMVTARHGAVAGPTADHGFAFVAGGSSVDAQGDSVVSANAETYRFATIMTDKDDYYPGETVFITGSGWIPGETVSLLLQEWDNEHSDRVFEPIADADGTIAASFLVEPHHLGVRFYLTARGADSKAQMTFTDAPRIGAVTVGAQSPTPLTAGNSATYSVSIARTQNGTVNGVMDIDWGGPAPTGITHSFSPATWTANGGNAFPTVVLTLTTDGTTEAGTYSFAVEAAAGTDVSTGGAGTLVVVVPCTAPTITAQPSAVSVTYGSNAIFTAAASGEPAPSVQWQVSTTGGASWVNLEGQTATTLTLTSPSVALSGHQYRAVFTNNCHGAQIVPTDGATLTVGALSVTGSFTASSKVYDGDTATDVLTRSLSGVVGEDDVALIGGTAAFADANAGTGKVVSLSGASLSGADAGNYSLGSVDTTTADIFKADATISVDGYNGVYDGAAHGASGSATGVNGEALSGLDLGDSFTNVPGGTANWTFTDETGNYNDATGTAAIVIWKADATVVVNGYSGVYDGAAHGASGSATGVNGEALNGLDLGDRFTNVPGGTANWTFTDETGNYKDAAGTATVVITTRTIDGSFTAADKVYDGSSIATILTRALPTGVVEGDDVSLSGGTANFDTSNVGTSKTVTGTGFTLAGAQAGNYELGTVAPTTADITPATVTGSFTAAHKVYDGAITATILTRWLPTGVVGTDDVTLTGGTATFDTSSVGIGKTVTGASFTLTGATAGNYQLGTVATTTANITAKELTVTGITANGKPWDGNTVATLDLTGAALIGVVAGDAVTLNTGAVTGTFASSSVGTWTVTITGLTISGSSSGNYTLTQPTSTASIAAWHMAGFHQPVGAINSAVLAPGAPLPAGNAGTMWHMIKGGNTVPLKFNVFSSEGGTELTSTSAAIASFQAWRLPSCVGGAAEDALEPTELSTGGTLLRYDVTGGQFIQNWQTPKVGGSDLCYRATVTAKDGSTISAFFKVKK